MSGANDARRAAASSWGIASIPYLRSMVASEGLHYRPGGLLAEETVLGWGRKPHAERARLRAERAGVPYVALEDGFVRSMELGVEGAAPWSIVVDDQGIYYDATQPSRLEGLLENSRELDDHRLLERAERCMALIRQERISKYNQLPVIDLGLKTRRRILVVDQSAGDLSLRLGLAPSRGVVELVEAALEAHPDAEIVVKIHPDVASGKRNGGAVGALGHPRVRAITAAANPMAMLEQVDEVYVMTSLMGFEALLMGLPVTCFGAPFYAGWGATRDRVAVSRRTRRRTTTQIFAAAYLLYARYVDPITGRASTLEDVLEHVARQRRLHAPRATVAIGFSLWKQAFLPGFLGAEHGTVRFARDVAEAEAGGIPGGARIAIWGQRVSPELAELVRRYGAELVRIEDGFLRSIGLGSDLYSPASLVLDRHGIYYDPGQPSDLEIILATKTWSEPERSRAKALRERIVASRLSKYGFGAAQSFDATEARARGQRVILVVGQVEDDASIRLGTTDVHSNTELLRQARRARPEAFIVWKPHPDVVAGNRQGAVDEELARTLANELVPRASIAECLELADEVHTMTSLVGFEALLRGKAVVVYGQPFYSGWGLTQDRHAHPRRTRQLTLDELVHATLIDYPVYVDPSTQRCATPEQIVAFLEAERVRQSRPERQAVEALLGHHARKGVNLLRAVTRARPLVASAERQVRSLGHVLAPAPARRINEPPALGLRNVLLLQGPAGPFFRRFADELSTAGVNVTKVNFHAGDVLFYPGPNAVPYRGRLSEFREWISEFMSERRIDGVVVFGDCRAYHRHAIEAARALGVAVWVFEEGYLRPDWVTLERDGVNGHSLLPRNRETYLRAYRAAGSPSETPPTPVGDTFTLGAIYSTLNAIAFTFANASFPSYEHHRNLGAFYHAYHWVLGAARKAYFQRTEDGVLEEIIERWDGRYFFVPLQVYCDFQITHSPYGDVTDFIHEVVASFARHAPPDCALVLKHHPMDRPFREYGALFRQLVQQHGLEGRLYYVHDLHLPTLLTHARGTVTINSTVGLSSIHHGTPVKVMGKAIYDIPGLTQTGTLEEMWRAPQPVDGELYRAFRWWLLQHTQGNGHMFRRVHSCDIGTGIHWAPAPLARELED